MEDKNLSMHSLSLAFSHSLNTFFFDFFRIQRFRMKTQSDYALRCTQSIIFLTMLANAQRCI